MLIEQVSRPSFNPRRNRWEVTVWHRWRTDRALVFQDVDRFDTYAEADLYCKILFHASR